LDADNEVLPRCFGRLLDALDGDPEAAFAYGMLERFTSWGTVGLANVHAWDPDRFRTGNYIDAMAMIRTELLRAAGGYRTDPRLHGWEDFDLWCRMAEAGMHAAHVPAVVARYRQSDHSMLSLTNFSGAEATSVIAEGSPRVMAGAVVPA
jgi:GT2 family glycosyltransferase